MLGRLAAAAAALIALTACAGAESAGRNARTSSTVAAAPPRSAPASTVAAPAVAAPAPTQMAAAAPPSAPSPRATEPQVQTPPPSAPPIAQTSAPSRPVAPNVEDDEVVVPGQVERQVQPPQGDPRSNSERMQDINAWDRCVTHVQAAFERDPMRPQLQSPEEYCAQSLGMSDRTAVPESRRD